MNAARLAQALRGALVRLAGEEPPKPGSFTDAIEWHRARDRMLTKKDWRALGTAERQRAFTVANVAQLDIINDVWKAMDKAVDQGTTFEEFKKEVGDKLIKEWKGTVKNPAHRLETIFRTNVQVAYGAGRWKAAKAAVKTHPFWQLAVVRDKRTSDTCLGVAGIVLPADDDWWKTNVPPRHFNCRSTIRSLRKREAERIRGEREKEGLPNAPGGSKAQEGFGDEPPDTTAKADAPGTTRPEGIKGPEAATAQPKPAPLDDVVAKKLASAAAPLGAVAVAKGLGAGGGPPRWVNPTPPEDNPPWWMDGKPRPVGVLDETKGRLLPHERLLALYLIGQGNDVIVREASTEDGTKNPDVEVNPHRTDVRDHIVELKSILKIDADEKTLLNAFRKKGRGRQARNLVIDARGRPALTEDVVLRTIAKAVRLRAIHPGRFAYIRVVGDGFDLTLQVA